MSTEIHHYDSRGRPCDKYGHVIHPKIVRDGETVTVNLMLMDSAQRAVNARDADYQQGLRDGLRALGRPVTDEQELALQDAAQADYDEWMHGRLTYDEVQARATEREPVADANDVYARWLHGEAVAC